MVFDFKKIARTCPIPVKAVFVVEDLDGFELCGLVIVLFAVVFATLDFAFLLFTIGVVHDASDHVGQIVDGFLCSLVLNRG
jgi:hypothetical protein